jgi:hypothetical protein
MRSNRSSGACDAGEKRAVKIAFSCSMEQGRRQLSSGFLPWRQTALLGFFERLRSR